MSVAERVGSLYKKAKVRALALLGVACVECLLGRFARALRLQQADVFALHGFVHGAH